VLAQKGIFPWWEVLENKFPLLWLDYFAEGSKSFGKLLEFCHHIYQSREFPYKEHTWPQNVMAKFWQLAKGFCTLGKIVRPQQCPSVFGDFSCHADIGRWLKYFYHQNLEEPFKYCFIITLQDEEWHRRAPTKVSQCISLVCKTVISTWKHSSWRIFTTAHFSRERISNEYLTPFLSSSAFRFQKFKFYRPLSLPWPDYFAGG